jgi:hypothetical protein
MKLRRMTSLIFIAILFGLLMNSQPVHAQPSYYVWTDENGNVRFANDLSEVPEKYKKLAVPGPARQGTKGTGGKGEKARPLGDSTFVASSIPKFQVVAQYDTALSILVPQNTTAEQLKGLIYEFQNARRTNSLSKMIPAATGSVAWICVLSEPDWATSYRLQRFLQSNIHSAEDEQFDKEYVKHIRAVYFCNRLKEHGSLGYDDGIVRSPNYEELF